MVARLGKCKKDARNQMFHLSRNQPHQHLYQLPTHVSPIDHPDVCLQPHVKQKQQKFDAVAFEQPDGDITVVALNLGADSHTITLYDAASKQGATVPIRGRSIASYTWSPLGSSEKTA